MFGERQLRALERRVKEHVADVAFRRGAELPFEVVIDESLTERLTHLATYEASRSPLPDETKETINALLIDAVVAFKHGTEDVDLLAVLDWTRAIEDAARAESAVNIEPEAERAPTAPRATAANEAVPSEPDANESTPKRRKARFGRINHSDTVNINGTEAWVSRGHRDLTERTNFSSVSRRS